MAVVNIDMSGKVALVTGGGYGMGRASARRFAQAGARVVIADIDVENGKRTAALIGDAGGEALFVEADVSRSEDVQRMIEQTLATFGRLDYAHNNAGIIEGQERVVDFPEERWHRILANNLTSVFLCLKYEIPAMLRTGGGAIVNVASETTYKGSVGDVAYTSSKHGVYGITTVVGLQYAKQNIRVNAIAPGNVLTGIIERGRAVGTPEQNRWVEEVQPIGRISEPAEIAEVVVWLCSDAATLINASLIPADTGWHVA